MEIIKISSSNSNQVNQFHELVKKVYQFDKHYIMPIIDDVEAVFDPSKNKKFASGNAERWLLFDNHDCFGRIAAFYENKNGKISGAWGFFEVLEIRHININIENIKFYQLDITKQSDYYNNSCDCISCLHTIEHFGLGRYGDIVDADAWKLAFTNISLILNNNGVLWLSTPIGIERVEFNANRIFNPNTIIDFAINLNLQLEEFAYFINDNVIKSDNIINDISKLSNLDYSLGIFKFRKINNL